MDARPPLLGLIPAAGHASRLGAITGSKEMIAVPDPESGAPRPVSEYLLGALAAAGVERAYLVLRTGKWDLPQHFALTKPPLGLELAYLMTSGTASIPETLDLAYPFVREATVVTGFPDSCFTPPDAVARAVARHRRGQAAVTLALFPSDRPDKTDMVELDGDTVKGFRVKPGACALEYTFGAAVWGPELTEFLHQLLAAAATRGSELQISEVLGAALEAGLTIEAEPSPGGRYIDVGTPEDLARVRQQGLES